MVLVDGSTKFDSFDVYDRCHMILRVTCELTRYLVKTDP